jgi:hypothetical protein
MESTMTAYFTEQYHRLIEKMRYFHNYKLIIHLYDGNTAEVHLDKLRDYEADAIARALASGHWELLR